MKPIDLDALKTRFYLLLLLIVSVGWLSSDFNGRRIAVMSEGIKQLASECITTTMAKIDVLETRRQELLGLYTAP